MPWVRTNPEGNTSAEIEIKPPTADIRKRLSEVTGIPNLNLTNKDVFDVLLEEDFDAEEFIDYLNDHNIDELNGIEFGCGYDELFENISKNPENPVIPLIRYIFALTRCETKEVEPLIALAQGKYADELEIPASDIEEEYRSIDEGFNLRG